MFTVWIDYSQQGGAYVKYDCSSNVYYFLVLASVSGSACEFNDAQINALTTQPLLVAVSAPEGGGAPFTHDHP